VRRTVAHSRRGSTKVVVLFKYSCAKTDVIERKRMKFQKIEVFAMFKIHVLAALIFAFLFTGCESHQKLSEPGSRDPASIKKSPVITADSLSFARTNAIRNSIFNSVVASYSLVKSQDDYEDLFLTQFSKADRKLLRVSFSENMRMTKKWPTIENEDGKLIAKLGKSKVVVEWPDVTRTEYRVNGVKWAYNPSKPYVPQLRILLQKLEVQKRSAAAMLLLPRAEANPLLALPAAFQLIAGTVIVTAVTNKLIDNFGSVVVDNLGEGYCMLLDKAGGVGVLTMCAQWKDKQVEKELAGFPDLSSLAREEEAGRPGSILANWESKATSCPTNNDGKERVYSAWIRKLEYKDGKKSGNGEWARIRAVFGADRVPKSIVIAPRDIDPATALDNPETATKIFAKVNFEKTKMRMTGIEIPNPDWDKEKKGPLAAPTISIGPGFDTTPKQKETLQRAKSLTNYVDKKVTQCIVEAAEVDIEKGIEPMKPTGDAAPKEAAPASGTVK
jgi:hypothetical protein